MLARKIIFYLLPPLVFASLIGGIYWHTRAKQTPPDTPEPKPPVVQPDAPGNDDYPGQEVTSGATATQPTANSAGNAGADAKTVESTPASRALTQEELMAEAPTFSDSPFWAKLLAQTTPAMRLVMAIDAMANGQRPLDALDFLHVETPFTARRKGDGGDWVATAESYARYQTAVDFVDSLEPQKVAEWFTRAEPVLQQCCKKLGYQDKSIRMLLTEAFNTILTAPRFDFDPQLVPTGATGTYHFVDPVFEQLNDAQKLLVRLGPANCAKIQAKCEAIADALKLYR